MRIEQRGHRCAPPRLPSFLSPVEPGHHNRRMAWRADPGGGLVHDRMHLTTRMLEV
jgi:hypothetical protein